MLEYFKFYKELKMKKIVLLFLGLLMLSSTALANVRFGVGLNWVGNAGLGMGFDVGVGWESWGFDLAHYGVQEDTQSFGSVALSTNLLGVYYKPFDFLLLQTGLHNLQLDLGGTTEKVLGTKQSVNWSGPYFMLSVPIRIEQTYFVRPFWGVLSVDSGKRTEVSWGLALGAEFSSNEDFIKLWD